MLRRILKLLAVVALLALLIGVAGWAYAAHRLEATPVAGLAPVSEGRPTNVLVIHTATDESATPLAVHVLQLRSGAEPRALDLPVELEVTRPGASAAPVATVFEDGGRDGLVAAVTDYTGIELHHLVQLNLDGLEELAHVAAGPSCPEGTCVSTSFDVVRRDGVLDLEAVPDHLASLQALASDVARTENLLSPMMMKRLADALPAAVRTDVELGPRGAVELVRALASVDAAGLDLRTVPGFHDPATGRTTPYWEQAETVFQGFREGTPLPADLGRTDPKDELLVPESIRVLVLNGIGLEGLAGRVATQLERLGFDVVGADNADEFDEGLTTTVVAHRPGRAHEGELVASELDGAVLEERSDLPRGADVVVTVGRDRVER